MTCDFKSQLGLFEIVPRGEKNGEVGVFKSEKPRLLALEELPGWYGDNEFIRDGYRPVMADVKSCLSSLEYVHNETANIFSHLIPGLLAIAVGFLGCQQYFDARYLQSSIADKYMFGFYFLTVATCMLLSASFHTFTNHATLHRHAIRMDFLGIIVLALGDFISGCYVAFYCEPATQKLYWTMFCFLGVLVGLVTLTPFFESKQWRLFRLAVMMTPGFLALLPVAHTRQLYPADQRAARTGAHYFLVEGLLLVLGCLIYAARIPEVWRPGRYDIWGASHQLFHVCVVTATVSHVLGLHQAFEYNYMRGSCTR